MHLYLTHDLCASLLKLLFVSHDISTSFRYSFCILLPLHRLRVAEDAGGNSSPPYPVQSRCIAVPEVPYRVPGYRVPIPRFPSPRSHNLFAPSSSNASLSLIASLLVYAPLYHLVGHRQSSFDHVTSSSSSSSSIILLLFRVLVFSEFQQRSIASSSAITVFPLHRLVSPSSLTHHRLS